MLGSKYLRIQVSFKVSRNTCLISASFDASQIPLLRCGDGSHAHIGDVELREMHDLRMVEILRHANPRKKLRAVARLIRTVPVRGLSAKVGAPLAVAVQGGELWARQMLAEIRVR